jgi:hypothetical protein
VRWTLPSRFNSPLRNSPRNLLQPPRTPFANGPRYPSPAHTLHCLRLALGSVPWPLSPLSWPAPSLRAAEIKRLLQQTMTRELGSTLLHWLSCESAPEITRFGRRELVSPRSALSRDCCLSLCKPSKARGKLFGIRNLHQIGKVLNPKRMTFSSVPQATVAAFYFSKDKFSGSKHTFSGSRPSRTVLRIGAV